MICLLNGDLEVFLNNVSLGAATATGNDGDCVSVETRPSIAVNVPVTFTTAIKDAYNIGGSNTLTMSVGGAQQCIYGAEVVVQVQVLGVEDSEYASLEVYPNPAREFLIVTGLKSAKRFNVYDILGKNVLNGAVSNHQTIVVRSLQKGLYFLRFPYGGIQPNS